MVCYCNTEPDGPCISRDIWPLTVIVILPFPSWYLKWPFSKKFTIPKFFIYFLSPSCELPNTVERLALLHHVWEVPGSNLSLILSFLTGFSWFYPITPSKCQDSTLKWAITASFLIHLNSLFTDHSIFLH
jgi:hypothetical protein